MKKKAGAIPVSIELLELVKQRQFERSKEEGKILTLTEVSNEIVKRGLGFTSKNNEIKQEK